MSTPATIPIFDPQGVLRDVPEDQLAIAVKSGGMPAVKFLTPEKNPDGTRKTRFVPANRYQEAARAGGTVMPFADQDIKHPGFWSTLKDYASSGVSGLYHAAVDPLTDTHEDLVRKNREEEAADRALEISPEHQAHGTFYKSALTPAAQLVGVRVADMEQHAAKGDVAGVMGEAAGPVAVMALTDAAAKGAPAVARFSSDMAEALSKPVESFKNLTPKQAAQALGAATGAGLGHGTLSVPGAYYGAKGAGSMVESILGKERAGSPIFAGKPTYPGAPLPEVPPASVLQANPLTYGARPVVDPAAGLGQIPARMQPPAAAAPAAVPEPISKTAAAGDTIPRTLSGDSALRQILTGQDNANLMKIAKSRGINVTAEAQLKSGVADPRLINKIIADFSDDELSGIRDSYLENTRMGKHDFGDIGPEAWKNLSLQTYFPDVKIPAASMIRTWRAVADASAKSAVPKYAPTVDLEQILRDSLKQAQAKKAAQ